MLITEIRLAPRLMNGVILVLSLHAFLAWTGKPLLLPLPLYVIQVLSRTVLLRYKYIIFNTLLSCVFSLSSSLKHTVFLPYLLGFQNR